MNNQELIYKIVKSIPKGKVLTYGIVANMAGIKSPRLVGSILHNNPDPISVPCHRVVNAQGKVAKRYAFGGEIEQRAKLESEGVEFQNDKIDLSKYLFR